MNNSKKIALFISMLTFVAGCSNQIKPTVSRIVIPQIEQISTIGIGDEILTEGIGFTSSSIRFSEETILGKYLIHKGNYPLESSSDGTKTFGHASIDFANGERDNTKQIRVETNKNQMCIIFDCVQISTPVNYSTLVSFAPNSFHQTLIYSGKIGNHITFGYREFTNGMARPAFNNEVTYDLSDSMIIGYKGSRIEVIKATNVDITYKVIKGFD